MTLPGRYAAVGRNAVASAAEPSYWESLGQEDSWEAGDVSTSVPRLGIPLEREELLPNRVRALAVLEADQGVAAPPLHFLRQPASDLPEVRVLT